jgi:phosphatidylinositol glycan class K
MWKALLLTVLLAAASNVASSRAQGGVDLNRTVRGGRVDGDGGNHPDLIENFIGLDIGSPSPNTWAVIVDTSRYWLNYRHATNAVAVYQAVKGLGIPDSRILLLLAEDFGHNPRNVFQNTLFLDPDLQVDVRKGQVQCDYTGDEVSVENFARLLTGRHHASLPRSKKLSSNARSNVLLYITGHGGENYMKFQDSEQIMGEDLADLLAQMHRLGRYRNLLVVVETCKASTLCQHISGPNTACVASSLRGQNSYSKHSNEEIGNSLVDEMTFHLFRYLSRMNKKKHVKGGEYAAMTLSQLFRELEKKLEYSTPFLGTYNLGREPSEIKLSEFFGT